ncbi:hypothetical protein G5F52_000592 [Campylobacter lari]|nr:hypothetical protein [Campylobacter lari]
MNLYLHIGTMKTGTSTIQDFLFFNRELLIKNDFLYPISIKNEGILNDHNVIVDIIENNQICKIKAFKKELSKFKCSNVIISAENIQWKFNTIRHVKKMKDFFENIGFQNIYILIYLREPSELYLSMSSQAIKDNHYADFMFLEPWNNKKALDLCNYKKTILRYEKIFSKEKLIVRLFSKNDFINNSLIEDFTNSLKLKWNKEFKIPKNSNGSLNILGIELVKAINQSNAWVDDYQMRYEDILLFVDKYFSKSTTDVLKFFPPKEIILLYQSYFKQSNEYVRKLFFPHKKILFLPKDKQNYNENYQLYNINKEEIENILRFIAEILNYKNHQIANYKKIMRKREFRVANFIFNFRLKIKKAIKYLNSTL